MHHITLDAFTKAHPHKLSYGQSVAASWSAFGKEPSDIRMAVLAILAFVIICALLMARGLVRR